MQFDLSDISLIYLSSYYKLIRQYKDSIASHNGLARLSRSYNNFTLNRRDQGNRLIYILPIFAGLANREMVFQVLAIQC